MKKNNTSLSGWAFFSTLWNTLETIPEWKWYDNKILMVAFLEDNDASNNELKHFYIHTNIAITKDTTAIQYYLAINKHINNFYELSYILM